MVRRRRKIEGTQIGSLRIQQFWMKATVCPQEGGQAMDGVRERYVQTKDTELVEVPLHLSSDGKAKRHSVLFSPQRMGCVMV